MIENKRNNKEALSSFHNFIILEKQKQLGEMPALHQEYYLIEDILFCMMSIEGNYVKRVPDLDNKNLYSYAIEP